GFWPGQEGFPEPAFYSYTAPEPDGIREQPLQPAAASWVDGPTGLLAVLPYEDVRTSADPKATLLAFLESAYQAGAVSAGWDRDGLRSSFCPTPLGARGGPA